MIWIIVIIVTFVIAGIIAWASEKDNETGSTKTGSTPETKPVVTMSFTDGGKRPLDPNHVLYTRECLPREREKQVITVDEDGVPNFRFKKWKEQLVPWVPEGVINPSSPSLYKYDVFIFDVRGRTYYEEANRLAKFKIGESVILKREPWNEYDTNAIAVYDANGIGPVGHVNKLNAKRLAPRLAAGERFATVVLREKPQIAVIPELFKDKLFGEITTIKELV